MPPRFARSIRDIKTSLRKLPDDSDGTNFMDCSMLPGEVIEVIGQDRSGCWVQVQLALTGAHGYVRKNYLGPCPEGTRVHDRLTAVPSEAHTIELEASGSRFKELQEFMCRSDTHRRQIRAKRIWHITGHYLGETGMVTGRKEVLFHGTSDDAAEKIVVSGFDDQFCSKGGAFGPGLYFSPQACKAMSYAENHLVIAEVALGLEENRLTCTKPARHLTYDIVFRTMGKRSCQPRRSAVQS